uniref:Protein CUSTOS n=1 Tax=Cyclopterus lumpus TaxID=8103 RepID=A0A8C2XMF5_CYCLU
MAALAKKMVGVSDDSSSSDEEVLKRCQEAAWETRSDTKKGDVTLYQWYNVCIAYRYLNIRSLTCVFLCNSLVVADHEHDCNELQVTQGFRTHVAKKLGHFLDRYFLFILVLSAFYGDSTILSLHAIQVCFRFFFKGFLLFSTSVPGQVADDSPAPVKRRPVPSSSESDSEMETRLREAAVSVKDLLLESSMLQTFSTPSAELPCSEKIKKDAEGQESPVVKKKKKKKKRKQNQEQGEQVDSAGSPHNAQINGEQELVQVKGKRKRKRTKKQRELPTKEEALN